MTVTLYVVVAFGATVIAGVVAPVDQRYEVKPAPASSVTEELGHVCVGPVIATTGGADVGIVAEPVLVQEPVVTETLRMTLPLAPAVKVMAFVFVALVIVPFVIPHE